MRASKVSSSRSSLEVTSENPLPKSGLQKDEESQNDAHWPSSPATTILTTPNSGISPRQLLRLLGRLLYLLAPNCLRLFHKNGMPQVEKASSTAFLDGMRGMAAFVVFICHLTYGTFDIGHAYGAIPEGESPRDSSHGSLLRLPIVRLLYSGPPMVAIFFVISGYVLSYKPLKLMRAQQYECLMLSATSTVFRRGLRLFLPCFASTFLVAILAQLNLYKITEAFSEQMRGIREDHCYTQPDPWSQFTDWCQQMLIFTNVFDWSLYGGSIELDRHLWTIPVEYRCSMVLFLTHIMVARMPPRIRLSVLVGLMALGANWNRWDLCPFWAGMIIAELDLISIEQTSNRLSFSALATNTSDLKEARWHIASTTRQPGKGPMDATYWLLWALSLFLLSYPDAAGHATPGYVTLTSLIPANFTQMHRFWPTVGAILIVLSTCNLDFLRNKIFCSRPLQYMGRISFPLYVMHGPVIHTLGYLILPTTIARATPDAMRDFEMAFFKSSLVIILAVMWVSDIFLRMVDTPCVILARNLEKRMFLE
ncbi:uncharacterized protein A1O9_05813 [Exophiala aquamarina CBS 119918]|uniref:Acyltransferase 3 domain-containing protein n=1 Tax=Exophiala aquamarina CBS 119918 TaxID=1182545 RepID=A0A072PDQ8_9EURO|nr:uncharacterized protein A1O9_05813 [Exophiala aquamarina CBS 119918]KEF57892.1 hypothetical protein A1O9_05813 [Exophiala aquamarina CBS 119918]